MYSTIDIDFDVYKEILVRRSSPEITENDVLRDLLGLNQQKSLSPKINGAMTTSVGVPYVWKGVTFPHGTEFRAEYSGRKYYAKVENGAIVYDGKRYKSPSPAATAITGSPWNGWTFWECKMPGKNDWILISKLRKS